MSNSCATFVTFCPHMRQIAESDPSTSLNAMWRAYHHSRLKDIANCPNCHTKLLTIALVFVYKIERRSGKSGEAVGAAATTTFGYDYTGQRVISQTASSTTVFPSKYFSVTSTQVGSSTLATSTSYIYNNDQLVAYVEQDLINSVATGTPRTFYVHPDHLGSTNVVTGENGEIISSKDYLPYGSVRIDSGGSSLRRGYIGEFEEGGNLSYLNARFYQSDRGQFLSQDPVFWSQKMNLQNPQSLNSYAYANGNPITLKDPTGLYGEWGARPVAVFGAHQFVYWQPQDTNLINYSALGIPVGTTEFTMGFYNPGSGYLESGIYYPGAKNAPAGAQTDFESHGSRMPITGMTAQQEADAINAMGQAISSYDNKSVKYPSVKSTISGTGINSNSGIHTLATISGLSSQFNSYNPRGWSSGANLYLPAQSFSSASIQNQITVISLQIQVMQLQRQIAELQTSSAKSTPQTVTR